jgi:hypothetical protein
VCWSPILVAVDPGLVLLDQRDMVTGLLGELAHVLLHDVTERLDPAGCERIIRTLLIGIVVLT